MDRGEDKHSQKQAMNELRAQLDQAIAPWAAYEAALRMAYQEWQTRNQPDDIRNSSSAHPLAELG